MICSDNCRRRLTELDTRLVELELRVMMRRVEDVADALEECYRLDWEMWRFFDDHGLSYARFKSGAVCFADLKFGVDRLRHALDDVDAPA